MKPLLLVGPLLLGLSSGLGGCAPDLPATPAPSVVVAEFDPSASPPRLPQPSDLLRDPTTGRPTVVDGAEASPAQRELNAYLRTLDGFPPAQIPRASFSAPVDPATLTLSTLARPGAVALFDAGDMRPLAGDEVKLAATADGLGFTLTPTAGSFRLGHRYLVLVFGGADPSGVKAADPARRVVAAPSTFFLRSRRPLFERCADDSPACACPIDGAGRPGPGCTPLIGLTEAEARRLEPLRRDLAATWERLTGALGGERKREDLVLAWSFTIAAGPFAALEPKAGRSPFPSDLFTDPASGRLRLPVEAGLTDAHKALLGALGGLDGFSTTADLTVPIDTADGAAPTGAVAEETVRLLHLGSPRLAPRFTVAARQTGGGRDYAGQLALTPRFALLPDGARYLGVVTSGVKDGQGRPLRPSVAMQLVKSRSPVAEWGRSTVEGVDDATASRLEGLRVGFLKGRYWEALESVGIPRDEVAAVWSFRTQAMDKTLRDLALLPESRRLPTAVTLLAVEPVAGKIVGQPAPSVAALAHGRLTTRLALGADGTLDLAGGRAATVPFLLALPKTPPPGGAPIVVVQHGFGGWRGDARFVAEALAAQGLATLAIDLHDHGARAVCRESRHCAMGGGCNQGTCTSRLAVSCTADDQCDAGGKCNSMTGACATALAAESRLCMTHREAGMAVTECNPVASGAAFVTLGSPLPLRDSLRQQVVDLAQLFRVAQSADPQGLVAQLARAGHKLDPRRQGLLGASLGAITGALFLAAYDQPLPAVLTVPGGRLVDLFAASPAYRDAVSALHAGYGVHADTRESLRLLDLLRLALDPGDPINYARGLLGGDLPCPGNRRCPKTLIVQQAGADMTVPAAATSALVAELGLPVDQEGKPGVVATLVGPPAPPRFVSTHFAGAGHGLLFANPPATGTAKARLQAATWLATDGAKISAP